MKDDKSLAHKLHGENNGAYIFVIEGKATVAGQQLGKRDALGISDTDSFEITADEKSDVIVFEVPMF